MRDRFLVVARNLCTLIDNSRSAPANRRKISRFVRELNLTCHKCHHEWEEDPSASIGVVQCPECFAVVPMVLAKHDAPAPPHDDTKAAASQQETKVSPPPAAARPPSSAGETKTIIPTSAAPPPSASDVRKPHISISNQAPKPLSQRPASQNPQARIPTTKSDSSSDIYEQKTIIEPQGTAPRGPTAGTSSAGVTKTFTPSGTPPISKPSREDSDPYAHTQIVPGVQRGDSPEPPAPPPKFPRRSARPDDVSTDALGKTAITGTHEDSRAQPSSSSKSTSRDFSQAMPKEIDLTGQTVGGYEVKKMLGAGGMGAVCLARQISLDRDVALKILPGRLAKNPEFLARFTREALSAAQLTHHNVIQVHDVGNDNDIHFISMEFVRGDNLGNMVRHDGKLSIDDAAAYVLQAARGLKYAHELGIVHRDIKPDNLMVNEHGIVKVADLGLAKMRHEAETTLPQSPEDAQILQKARGDITLAEVAMGTPAYMPPEQARDASSVDARADQYSLGCTLYYLCSGKAPYSGSTAMEIITKHQTEPLTPLDTVVKHVPPALNAIISKMLNKDPDQRYTDMGGVIQALESYLGVESEKGAYTPREEHLMQLEAEQKNYYAAPSIKKRSIASAAFFLVSAVLVPLLIVLGHPFAAGGMLGLLVMTPVANFITDGILRRTYLFRRVRSVFFGMTWRGWATTILGVALFLGALWKLSLLLPWILFAAFAVGIAIVYQRQIVGTLRGERAESIANMQQMLKQLRVRGVSEEQLQDFVSRFSGAHWEEFFEELFGYEAMLLARGKWAAADKIKPRKKFGTWRDPIARWMTAIEDHRREAREKRQLAKVEVQRLKAKGVSDKDAERQAAEAATQMMTDIRIASQIVEPETGKKRARSYTATPGMSAMGLQLVRFVAGAGICVYFATYFFQKWLPANSQEYAEKILDAPIPGAIATMMKSFWGAFAGVALLVSAFSRNWFAAIPAFAGAALILGRPWIAPIVLKVVPTLGDTNYMYAACAIAAVGIVVPVVAKLARRS